MCVFIAWLGLRSQVQKTAWGYAPLSATNLIKGKKQTDTQKILPLQETKPREKSKIFSLLPYTSPNVHLPPIVQRENIDYKKTGSLKWAFNLADLKATLFSALLPELACVLFFEMSSLPCKICHIALFIIDPSQFGNIA